LYAFDRPWASNKEVKSIKTLSKLAEKLTAFKGVKKSGDTGALRQNAVLPTIGLQHLIPQNYCEPKKYSKLKNLTSSLL